MQDSGNQVLVLDTDDGNISLAVDGSFDLDGTTIRVEGPGIVRVYADVSDEVGGGGEMNLDNGATVKTQDGSGTRSYNATQFWLYAPPGIDADIDSGSEFTGVIYAPDGGAHGQVSLTGSSVYGAVIAHLDGMDEGTGPAEVHFDEALTDSEVAFATESGRPRVTNMHVTVNDLEVRLEG